MYLIPRVNEEEKNRKGRNAKDEVVHKVTFL